MEDYIYDIIDEIIIINHQIGSYMIDFAKAEMEGQKVKVERNSILKLLFERLQVKYRELEQTLKEIPIVQIGEFSDENDTMLEDKEKQPNILGINDLETYIGSIYKDFHYVTATDIKGEDVITENNIYGKDKFEDLRSAEYILQIVALEDMMKRVAVDEEISDLTFSEKRYVLTDIAEKKFYKEYLIKQVVKEIKQLEAEKEEMDPEKYERIRKRLYERKYISYYSYLNNMYNGVMQENDKGKLAIVKKFIDAGAEQIILGMTKYEIEENIRIDITMMQNEHIKLMDEILEIDQEEISEEVENNLEEQEVQKQKIVEKLAVEDFDREEI